MQAKPAGNSGFMPATATCQRSREGIKKTRVLKIAGGYRINSGGNPLLGKCRKKTALSRQGKKMGCYEAYPIVNCVEPVVLWGTSLTKTE